MMDTKTGTIVAFDTPLGVCAVRWTEAGIASVRLPSAGTASLPRLADTDDVPDSIRSAIDGIVAEAEEIMSEASDPEVLDAAALASAQAVEHYEITRYGTLIAWARELGRPDCAGVLQQNLDEEKAADLKLTQLAEARVNRVAV